MTLSIRQAVVRDEDAVIKLQQEWVNEKNTHGCTSIDSIEFKRHLGPLFYVAEQGDVIVGFIWGSEHLNEDLCIFEKDERYVEIYDIYVKSSFRGSGIGGKLIARLESEAKALGIERFLVYSATKDLDRILEFYRNHDFKSWYVQMYK